MESDASHSILHAIKENEFDQDNHCSSSSKRARPEPLQYRNTLYIHNRSHTNASINITKEKTLNRTCHSPSALPFHAQIPPDQPHNRTISMTPNPRAPSSKARLGTTTHAALSVLLVPLPFLLPDVLGFFFLRASRCGFGSRAASFCAVAACAFAATSTARTVLGCATGAGFASARVAKRRVDTAAAFMVGWRCVIWYVCVALEGSLSKRLNR